MNRWNSAAAAAFSALNAETELTARGIELPTDVVDALDVVKRVKAAAPKAPPQTAVRDAIVAGASTDEIRQLLLDSSVHTRWATEHDQAVVIAGQQALAAIRRGADTIYPALKEQAEQLIDKLRRIAEIGTIGIDALVRDNRVDDAKLIADRDIVAAEFVALSNLRNTYLGRANHLTVGHFTADFWYSPEVAERHVRPDRSVAENIAEAERRGAELWFPSYAEAIERATELNAEWRERAARQAASRGSVALEIGA